LASGYPDLNNEYRNEQEEPREREEIHERHKGDIGLILQNMQSLS
jgi:hypothetical protein